MPHWTGMLFVLPMVVVIYVDLLGFIQWFGIDVNGVSYVSLLMAIGLLVDYMMHVTLRYYETPVISSRDAKVKDVLRTLGASVLLGGLSTFVGIVPLMFSASDIIHTFVVTFSGVVFLGRFQRPFLGEMHSTSGPSLTLFAFISCFDVRTCAWSHSFTRSLVIVGSTRAAVSYTCSGTAGVAQWKDPTDIPGDLN